MRPETASWEGLESRVESCEFRGAGQQEGGVQKGSNWMSKLKTASFAQVSEAGDASATNQRTWTPKVVKRGH